ncbi:4Fe-4S dicluster domain-containing protein [Symbiobacterium thermophilum]|uniref:4Fe-4S dicluster domain-containing protein n=1 Tax=Symbiobacterium thermophilum TaxID=2734 RepID=UPI0035C786EA
MTTQLGFHVDMEKCIGCKACEAACKDFYRLPPEVRWRRVRSFETGEFPKAIRVHLSLACNHCEDPACMKGCPVEAYTKRADGLVIHDPTACIGCQYCTWTCPYSVPQFDPEQGVVSKCNGCYQLVDQGQLPRCVQACLTGALSFGEVVAHEAQKRQAVRQAPGFPDPSVTRPATRFAWPEKGPQPDRRVRVAPPAGDGTSVGGAAETVVAAAGEVR